LIRMRTRRSNQELESILKRSVDFLSRRALGESPNWLCRDAILDSAQTPTTEN